MTQPAHRDVPLEVSGVELANWEHRRSGSERDVREAKYLLTANVFVMIFLKEYYEIEPLRFLESFSSLVTFAPFYLSTALCATVLALAYSRERAIAAILAGPDLAVSWNSTVKFAKSQIISHIIVKSFIISVVLFCVGIVMVVLFADKQRPNAGTDISRIGIHNCGDAMNGDPLAKTLRPCSDVQINAETAG